MRIANASGVFAGINGDWALATESGDENVCEWFKFVGNVELPPGVLVEYTLYSHFVPTASVGVPFDWYYQVFATWVESGLRIAEGRGFETIDEQIDCRVTPDMDLPDTIMLPSLFFPGPNFAGDWVGKWGNAGYNPF